MTAACMNYSSPACSSLPPPKQELVSSRLRAKISQDRAWDNMDRRDHTKT